MWLLLLAGDAEDPRRYRPEKGILREPETTARLDSEDLLDGRPGLALDVAPAHEARPDQVGGLLEAGEQDVTAAHVLVGAQLAARPQDPVELGQRHGHIGHRAQQP